jgi:uncharacterized protein
MTQLSRIERKILSNQYKMLERLDPDNADDYSYLRNIVDHGFEGDYEDVLRGTYEEPDTMSAVDCSYVGDVLQMYDMMQTAFKNGQQEGVELERLKFPGFDGNNETKFVAYAQHLRSHGKWTFIDLRSEDFNSHSPTEGRYRRMLAAWKESKDEHQLSAADILRILG